MNNRSTTILALICTVFFWGFSFIGIKFALKGFAPFIYMFLPMFMLQYHAVVWSAIPASAWGAIVFLAVFSTVGGYFCYKYALTKISASEASIFLNGIPIVATIVTWFILGERMTLLQIIGGLIVIAVVAIVNWPQRKPARGQIS